MLREELCTNLASVNRIARIGAIWDLDVDLTLDSSEVSSVLGALREYLRGEQDDRVHAHLTRFLVKWLEASGDETDGATFGTRPPNENSELKEVHLDDFSHQEKLNFGYENTALFSYAHADNDYHGGILTIAARVLNEAAYIHSGRKNFLEIVYDLRNIDIGENWQEKIDEMIDRSSILVPILSPAYFSSQHCMHELEQFSKKLAENDEHVMIMPIRLVEFNEISVKKNSTITKLLERQYAKWDWLRFKVEEIKKDERVTQEIDNFGLRLVQAISRINGFDQL